MICLGGDIWTECEEVEGSVIGSLTKSAITYLPRRKFYILLLPRTNSL